MRYFLLTTTAVLVSCTAVTAQTSALNRAATTVQSEVRAWGSNSGLAGEYLYALSAMNYVQSHLSSANYGALQAAGKLPANLDAERALALEAGLCGSHVDAFDKVLAACGAPFPRRAVEWYLHDEKKRNNRNHVAVEVFYASRWRLFDVTSCSIFPTEQAKSQDDLLCACDVMSEARRHEGSRAWRGRVVNNAAAVWNRQALANRYDSLEHLTWPDVDVLYARHGTIHLRPNREAIAYDLSNLFTFVGYTADYCGNVGEVKFELDPHAMGNEKREIELVINGSGDATPEAWLVVRDGEAVLHRAELQGLTAGSVTRIPIAPTTGTLTLAVESTRGKGYVDLRSATAR